MRNRHFLLACKSNYSRTSEAWRSFGRSRKNDSYIGEKGVIFSSSVSNVTDQKRINFTMVSFWLNLVQVSTILWLFIYYFAQVADMETNPILKTQLGEVVHSRNEQYQSLQLELDLMEERMAELERVVLSLSAGKLCKDVLPPKQLSQTLHNIEMQLPGNYSLVTLFAV